MAINNDTKMILTLVSGRIIRVEATGKTHANAKDTASEFSV